MGKSRHRRDIRSLVLILYSRFFPAFYILESVLKNKLFNLIGEELGDNWFQVQLNDDTNDQLFKAEINLIKNRKPSNYVITPQKLLLESGFGLWVEFFNSRIYKLAKGRPIKIFSKLPKNIKRANIYQYLIKVKDFRNLLVHSRLPLINEASGAKELDSILDHYRMLMELLEWIDEVPVFSLEEFENEINIIRNLLLSKSLDT